MNSYVNRMKWKRKQNEMETQAELNGNVNIMKR